MIQTKTAAARAPVDGIYLPPEKTGNKKIFPVQPQPTEPEYSIQPVSGSGLLNSAGTVQKSAGDTPSVLPGDNPKGNTLTGGLLQKAAQQYALGGVTGLDQSGQTEQPKQSDTAPIMTGGPVTAKLDTGIETPPVKPLGQESARPAVQATQQTGGGLMQNTAALGGQPEYKPVTTEMQANPPFSQRQRTASAHRWLRRLVSLPGSLPFTLN